MYLSPTDTDVTAPLCPSNVCSKIPEIRSQIYVIPSELEDIMYLLHLLTSTEVTSL